jgi:hypothetical protein
MNQKQINEFEALKIKVGRELKRLRIQSGYRSMKSLLGIIKLVVFNIGRWKKEQISL